MDTSNDQNKELLSQEKEILKEEKEILTEVKKEEKSLQKVKRNVWILNMLVALVIAGGLAAFVYFKTTSVRIYTDKAAVESPIISLAPKSSGILQEVYVHEGDRISADTTVARVGNELIKTQVDALVIGVKDDIGTTFNPGTAVVTVIDPNELRVVGRVSEDKGLRDVAVGQRAVFTVDAFGSKTYDGIVDEISPTSDQGDIVFNISDKRQENEFDVKVRFNIDKYPELKNGMSAKLWIYKQ